jgi:hypothetical protein
LDPPHGTGRACQPANPARGLLRLNDRIAMRVSLARTGPARRELSPLLQAFSSSCPQRGDGKASQPVAEAQ